MVISCARTAGTSCSHVSTDTGSLLFLVMIELPVHTLATKPGQKFSRTRIDIGEHAFDTETMGFGNPPIPWRQLERQLSGLPLAHIGDGGDSPAWSRKRDAYQPPQADPDEPVVGVARAVPPTSVRYAELHAHSSFSFLDGANTPEQMAEEAVRLGLSALALTDHDGFYGIVRFAEAAEALGLATVFGAELSLDVTIAKNQAERMIAARVGVPDPPQRHLLTLARGPAGYADDQYRADPRRRQGPARLRPRRAGRGGGR